MLDVALLLEEVCYLYTKKYVQECLLAQKHFSCYYLSQVSNLDMKSLLTDMLADHGAMRVLLLDVTTIRATPG